MPDAPVRVRFTQHAEDRCADYSRSLREITDLVIDLHQRRRRNPGSSDWLLAGQGVVIAFNWPDASDATAALVVTLWPRR